VSAAEGDVVAAQYNLRCGLGPSNVLYDFADALIPVGHHRLDEDKIKRLLSQEISEDIARQAETAEVTRDVRQGRGGGELLTVKSAPAPLVGLEALLLGHEWVQAVKIIEEGEFCFGPKITCDAKQAIRFHPEIISREIVNRGTYQQNLRSHSFRMLHQESKMSKKTLTQGR